MDYTKYIGLSYLENGRTEHGVDCWGLVCLFYKHEFNIDLPSYINEYSGANDPYLANFIKHTKISWNLTTSPKLGDVCVFNILGEPTHVGIYLNNQEFLHCRDGKDSVIESLKNHKWNRRLEGIYSYSTEPAVQVIARPHPLRQTTIIEVAQAGTTCLDFAKYLIDKYNLGKHISSRLIIMIDGYIIDRDRWSTTRLEPGQTITYKSIPQGREGLRLALSFAIAIAAPYAAGAFLGTTAAAAAAAGGVAQFTFVATAAAIQFAGMALLNAVLPIRPPEQKDPGSPTQLGLFTGSSNQINRFGPIPVVLGRVRYTGLLGATPYIKTKTTTTILNQVIVWGFGPLNVRDISVGANQIEDYYQDNLPDLVPTPITLYGKENEDVTAFEKLYPTDVQLAAGSTSVELVNTPSLSNPWTEATFTDPINSIDVAFNFPEGMRQIITKGENSGDSRATTCQLEVQLKKYYLGDSIQDQAWTNTSSDNSPAYKLQADYRNVLGSAAYIDDNGDTIQLWRKHVFCLGPNGQIAKFSGSATDIENSNPSQTLQTKYFQTNYSALLSSSQTFTYTPTIPNGFIKLYTLVIFGSSGIQSAKTENHLTAYNNQGYTGLTIAYENSYYQGVDPSTVDAVNDTIIIASGQLTELVSNQPNVSGTTTEIFNTRQLLNVEPVSQTILNIKSGIWGEFINTYGVWSTAANQAQTFDQTKVLNLTTSGIYRLEFSSDDNGQLLLDDTLIINYPKGGHRSSAVVERYISSGSHSLQLTATNTGGAAGIACKITFTNNVGQNSSPSSQNIITIGTAGFFEKQKDAFNYVHEFKNLNAKAQATVAITTATAADDKFTCSSETEFIQLTVGDRIRFQGTVFGGVQTNTNYYVKALDITNNKLTISANPDLSTTFNVVSNVTGSMNLIIQASSYKIRARRINSSLEEAPSGQGDYRNYHRCVYINSVGYSNNKPMLNPPGCYLAKTAMQIQSSNKINGQIDGINAIVETIGWDWDSVTEKYEPNRIINNPAALFIYVLTHPAIPKPYRITNANTEIDLDTIKIWHTFCNGVGTRPKLTYNAVISDTRSVMDVLRDICAAGMASPTYIDGKWSVVIETARNHVVQHFTPHNSWGFESTKTLPRIPDAFRISFVNEEKSYQQDELIVCNFDKTESTVELIEELNLPGVTNATQAKYLARFHFAQLKLRPETYTINVDFEYLVCTRGDLVRVSHDVPLWGSGTGRIKSFNGANIVLSDEIYLESAKTYKIRIRTNNLTTTAGTGFVLKTLTAVNTGYYTNISISDLAGNESLTSLGVEADNLYMIGETNKETQELIVLGIEPSSNLSARLTLVDYSPSIYSLDLSDANTQLPAYNSNITQTNNAIVKNTVTKAPIFVSSISNTGLSEQISPGNYQNVTIISFANPEEVSIQAEKVQLEIVAANSNFDIVGINQTYIVPKEQSSITINGLITGQVYKVRLRYTNSIGSVVGPWSDIKFISIEGKSTTLLSSPELTVDLANHYIIVLPNTNFTSNNSSISDTTLTIGNLSSGTPKIGMFLIATGILPNTYIVSGSGSSWQVDKSQTLTSTAIGGVLNNTDPSFKEYEFRLYKDSGSGDFWNLDVTNYGIKTTKNTVAGVFNLKEFSAPRISSAGINYRIACRAIDKNDNYSSSSTVGSIIIATIK